MDSFTFHCLLSVNPCKGGQPLTHSNWIILLAVHILRWSFSHIQFYKNFQQYQCNAVWATSSWVGRSLIQPHMQDRRYSLLYRTTSSWQSLSHVPCVTHAVCSAHCLLQHSRSTVSSPNCTLHITLYWNGRVSCAACHRNSRETRLFQNRNHVKDHIGLNVRVNDSSAPCTIETRHCALTVCQ